RLHRRLAHVQLLGDLAGGRRLVEHRSARRAPAQHLQHVALASRQLGRLGVADGALLLLALLGPEHQPGVAHTDLVSGAQGPVAHDALAVDERAVGGPEVTDRPARRQALDEGVLARGPLVVGQGNVVALGSADAELARFEGQQLGRLGTPDLEKGRHQPSSADGRRRRNSTYTSMPTSADSSSPSDSTTGWSPTYATSPSVQHHAMVRPVSPQSARVHPRTVATSVPSGFGAQSTLIGSCQHTDGFQSMGDSPASNAARCRAQPAPPAKPGRLRKMQAPSTTRVLERVSSAKTPPSAASAWCSKISGWSVAARAPMVIASSPTSRSAPIEQHPCPSSGAGWSRMPRQPRPQTHVQFDWKNVRS